MLVGIFGGSFNPIHTGHLRLARALVHQGLLDEIWLMVSPLNPLKQGQTDILDDEARLAMVQLATANEPHIQACDLEMHMPRPSYMVRTLETLRKNYPQHEFVLVIGSDNWQRFPQWRESDEILRHHKLLVYPRPGYELYATTLPQGVTLVNTPLYDISSTDIRHRIAQGNYHGRGLSRCVWQEIRKKGYYK